MMVMPMMISDEDNDDNDNNDDTHVENSNVNDCVQYLFFSANNKNKVILRTEA